MQLEARVKVPWNKGEFANLVSRSGKHWLELNWYADDSPVAGPFKEGDELDHLGFEVDDFEGALERLARPGYEPALGPFDAGNWHVAHLPTAEGIWLDIFHVDKPKGEEKPATRRKKSLK
jgi:hypothetical protein